jgi:hypothetical protein
MSIKTYCLCDVKTSANTGHYAFYDTGLNNYKFISLLDTGELVYANTITYVIHGLKHRAPVDKYLGNGVIHDVLSYKGTCVNDISLMIPYKEGLLTREFRIIEYTKEGDRHYGKLLSVEHLKKAFNL